MVRWRLSDLRAAIDRCPWHLAVLFLVALNVLGAAAFVRGESMAAGIHNGDTRMLADRVLREPHPLKWFWSDWPLGNGFYRPIPAFTFLLDAKLWGHWWPGYLDVEYVTAICCVVATVWFVWELTRSKPWALGAGLVLTLEQTNTALRLLNPWAAVLAVLLLGLCFRMRASIVLFLAGGTFRLIQELHAPPGAGDFFPVTFGFRVMDWPPGRTSVLMTLFALMSLASFIRWLRTGDAKWIWLTAATCVMSFCCYEQSVVLLPLYLGCALYVGTNDWRKVGTVCSAFLVATCAYLLWHRSAIPIDPTYAHNHHQGQTETTLDTLEFVLPGVRWFPGMVAAVSADTAIAIVTQSYLWASLGELLLGLTGLWVVRTRWKPALFGLATSLLAYAPLAVAKPLFHYEYFTACLRTMFLLALAGALYQLCLGDLSFKTGARLVDLAPEGGETGGVQTRKVVQDIR